MRKISVYLLIIIMTITGCSQGSEEVSKLNDEIKSLNENIDTLRDAIRKKDKSITNLKGNIDEAKKDIEKLNIEISKKNELIKSLNSTKNIMDLKLNNINIEDINYIAIDNLFLGTFEDGKWNSNQSTKYQRNQIEEISNVASIRDVTIEELNQNQTYYLFDDIGKIGETNKFLCVGYESYTSGTCDFISYDFDIDGKTYNPLIAVTQNYNPILQNVKLNVDTKDNHKSAVRKVLEDNGLTDTEIYITEIISADIDNDGIVEDIIIAGTPNDKNGYPKINDEDRFKDGAGVYITAIVLKNDKIIPIYFGGHKLKDLKYEKGTLPFGIDSCLNIGLIGIFDLNNDGKYEICVDISVWDIGNTRVYEWQEDDTIKEVLYGDFSW